MNWLDTFKHLLPNARAWRITVDKTLREFFEGLTGVGEDVQSFYDGIFSDLDPQQTRQLVAFEQQFALPDTGLNEQERRDRLDAAWKALGGQDPRYIQDTLQAAGFNVYVHEWWEPIGGRPNGGSINFDVTPVLRNPLTYLDDGASGVPWLMYDGTDDAQDGDAVSQDGSSNTPAGYPLVNKLLNVVDTVIGDGSEIMQDGGIKAQDSGIIVIYSEKQYIIPVDAAKWPYFLYIGGQTFPDTTTVSLSRRDEFEDLCLKICPTEQWLGILVIYS